MTKAPSFQFYTDDFIGGTKKFTAEEVGAYVLLLIEQYEQGYIKDDDLEIVSRLPIEKLTRVIAKFNKKKNGYVNKKMELVKKNQKKYRKINQKNGEKGARIRWHNKIKNNDLCSEAINSAKVSPSKQNGSPSPSPSPSPINNTNTYHTHTLLEVTEIMRRQLNRSFSDDLIERTSKKLLHDYSGEKISNLSALIGAYVKKLKPDCRVRFYNPGAASYGYMTIDKWEKIKNETALKFEAYELG